MFDGISGKLTGEVLIRKTNGITEYAAAAKSLQSCPTLCDPIDSSPPGSTVPGILQARTLEWVAISFSNEGNWKVKVKSLSHVRLFQTRVLEWGAIAFSNNWVYLSIILKFSYSCQSATYVIVLVEEDDWTCVFQCHVFYQGWQKEKRLSLQAQDHHHHHWLLLSAPGSLNKLSLLSLTNGVLFSWRVTCGNLENCPPPPPF